MKFQLKTLIILFTIFNSLVLVGQNSDCTNLLVLKDSIYNSVKITGFGSSKEFKGNNLKNNKLFENEANSIWYRIDIENDGVFTFDIVTDNKNDDWDFLLYRNEKYLCKKIVNNDVKPIRSNLSRSPITGLSVDAVDNFVSSGINTNYSKSVNVKKGDQFVLVVNNPKKSGGKQTLKLHLPNKIEVKKIANPQTDVANTINPNRLDSTRFKLVIKDASTKKRITGYGSISGLENKLILLNSVSEYEHSVIKKNRVVTIEAYASGYMLVSKEFNLSKTKSKYLQEIYLNKITVGDKVNLTAIQFYGNQFKFLPSATPSLELLLLFMQKNPTVKIEIGGHVNGPGQSNSKKYKLLSFNRAQVVNDCLIRNGINQNRIKYKGYGNSNMLYPKPKSPVQEVANRRVEIKILGK